MARQGRSSIEKSMTIMVAPDLEAVIRERAAVNHRSMTKEMVHLIEVALGVESDQVREAIHLLYKAGIEVR